MADEKGIDEMTDKQSSVVPLPEDLPEPWWEYGYDKPDFMRSVIPPSSWDQRLLEHIDQHLAMEATAGSAYEAFAKMGDAQIRYLTGLIASDEHRHHTMLSDLATSVRSTACEDPDPSKLSRSPHVTSDQSKALLKEARRLLDIENNDLSELKKLRADLRHAPAGTIWPVLVQIMALDTRKHIRILTAIKKRLKASC